MKPMLTSILSGGLYCISLAAGGAAPPPGAGNAPEPDPGFNLEQSISDQAQRTTIAFSGFAMITGNLEAQSFFPPGKVADYTGFQYLRDNDPDRMGHNTSFLTRVANNVIYLLDDNQFEQLKVLASTQIEQIERYGYLRYPLMQAFRRQLEGDVPAGPQGLNLRAVRQASRELYLLDGQISFDRALLYADILNSLDAAQAAYLDAMKGEGWASWPDVGDVQIRERMQGLPKGTAVAVMTYAGDLFSWYAGSVEADVYFCPERHGTYYGGFYVKDAPAVGREGYNIDEQLTARAGAVLSDSAEGYVTTEQAELMSSLVETQRDNLYASPIANIVQTRTEIAIALRSLLLPGVDADDVEARVLELSALYGDLDGANNHAYVNVFTQLYQSLTDEQMFWLQDLRDSILSGAYADGTPFDFSEASQFYLYSEVITLPALIDPYISDLLFFEPDGYAFPDEWIPSPGDDPNDPDPNAPDPNTPVDQGPPPQAYEDCIGKQAGDAVQHHTPEGIVNAICESLPEGLVARPIH